MIEIPLTQGAVALIDDHDLELVSAYRWWLDKRSEYQQYAYAQRKGERRSIRMHQLLMGFPNKEIDHVNRSGLDNRRSNLRLATRSQNAHNTRGRFLGRKGVTFQPRLTSYPWQARIAVEGHQIHLGYFGTAEEAALAYNKAATKHFGAFALLNEVQ